MRGSSSSTRVAGIAVLAVVAGGALWFAQRPPQSAAPVDGPATAPPAAGVAATAPPAAGVAAPAPDPAAAVTAPLPLQTPAAAGIAEADCIAYPDGTRLPPLNGVTKAPPVTFHRLVPYTKVVRKEFDPATGLDWYIHENGVRSTTRLQLRNGVPEAVSEVEMARPAAPVVPDK